MLTQQDATNISHNVCIVTRLLAGRSGVQVLEELRYFSLLQIAQTDCEIHSSASQWIAAFFPRKKRARSVMLNTHLRISAEVKNKWNYPPSPPTRLHLVNSGNFCFLILCLLDRPSS